MVTAAAAPCRSCLSGACSAAVGALQCAVPVHNAVTAGRVAVAEVCAGGLVCVIVCPLAACVHFSKQVVAPGDFVICYSSSAMAVIWVCEPCCASSRGCAVLVYVVGRVDWFRIKRNYVKLSGSGFRIT